MKFKPERYGILREKGIFFGDNEWGIVVKEKGPFTKEGTELKAFLIVPLPHLIQTYPDVNSQKYNPIQTHLGWAIWREYPTVWINDSDTSRSNAVVRVYCTFNGEETAETKRDKINEEEIREQAQEIDRLRLRIEYLKQENWDLLVDKVSYAAKENEYARLMKRVPTDEYEDNVPPER